MLYGKEIMNPPSRFINEIDESLLDIANPSMQEPSVIKKEGYLI